MHSAAQLLAAAAAAAAMERGRSPVRCVPQVTLHSKDAEALECEQRMIARLSADRLAEWNRTYKQNIGSL